MTHFLSVIQPWMERTNLGVFVRAQIMLTTNAGAWFIHQLKGLCLITAISLTMAAGTNTIRDDPIPWVEKCRLLKAGDKFPYFPLPSAEIPGFRNYLGLPPDKEIITIEDIQAELLVFEVLNAFCFPCQTQALTLNKVHKIIEGRSDLKGRIKIIGVALGNTKMIVEDFVDDYGLVFPIVSDPEALSEKRLGPGINTPFSLFIRPYASGELKMVAKTYDKAVEDPNVLIDDLTELLKMEPGSVNPNDLF